MKWFALKTLGGIFLIFGLIYMTMVFTHRVSFLVYITWCMFLAFGGVGLFLYADRIKANQVKSGFIGIVSGLLLWSFIGEFLAALDWIVIADWRFSPVLLLSIFFFIFLFIRGYLPNYALFTSGHFLIIWLLHSIMVFEIHILGKSQYPSVHLSTFITAGIFLIIASFSAWRMFNARSKMACMVWTIATLLFGWSFLEFIWAWRILPGPYSL